MVVTGNVLTDQLGNGLDMHAGSNNTVSNNVIFGGRLTMANDTAVGFFDGRHNMTNNRLERNVIIVQDPASVVLAGRPGLLRNENGDADTAVLSVRRNIYWSPSHALGGQSGRLFMNRSWASWRAMKMDTGSFVDRDPGFVDAAGGDWRLRGDALAHDIGFEALSVPFC